MSGGGPDSRSLGLGSKLKWKNRIPNKDLLILKSDGAGGTVAGRQAGRRRWCLGGAAAAVAGLEEGIDSTW